MALPCPWLRRCDFLPGCHFPYNLAHMLFGGAALLKPYGACSAQRHGQLPSVDGQAVFIVCFCAQACRRLHSRAATEGATMLASGPTAVQCILLSTSLLICSAVPPLNRSGLKISWFIPIFTQLSGGAGPRGLAGRPRRFHCKEGVYMTARTFHPASSYSPALCGPWKNGSQARSLVRVNVGPCLLGWDRRSRFA